jgi:hypothetical protein
VSDVVRVTAVIATDHALSAYGGIRLHKDALEGIAEALRSNRTDMLGSHDSTRPLHATVIDAGVRERDDGHFEVWAKFDADREPWEEYEQERAAANAPGGMSIAFSTPFGVFEGDSPRRPIVQIAADAFHFADEDLVEAGRALAPYADVHVSRLFQLSAEPPVKVAFEYGLVLLASLPPELFGSLVWESLRTLVAKARGRGHSTTIDFTAFESEGSWTVKAVIKTDDDDVAKEAIRRLPDLASERGRFTWTSDDWHRLNEPP